MDPRLRVETARFNSAMAEIGRITNDPAWQKKVIDFEVGKILETTIQRTERATIASIKKSQKSRGDYVTYDIGRGKKKYNLNNRYPDAIWRALQMRMAETLAKKMNAREFARQAWLELANALGFTVKATNQTRMAKVEGVSNRQNVRAEAGGTGGKYGIAMENNSPLIRFSEGRQAIFSAIVGRRKFFEATMRKTYTDKIRPFAERYGLKVS